MYRVDLDRRTRTRTTTKGLGMNITAEQVEQEHRAALASLTEPQRRALARLQQARQRATFNGRFPADNLKLIFAVEAENRTRKLAA